MGRTRRRSHIIRMWAAQSRRQNRRRHRFHGPIDRRVSYGNGDDLLVIRGSERVKRNARGLICIIDHDPDYVLRATDYRPRAWHQPSPLRAGLIKVRR